MNRRSLTKIGLSVAVAVVSLGAGFAGARALDDDDSGTGAARTVASMPPLANPVPVLEPVATGPAPKALRTASALVKAGRSQELTWVQPTSDPSSEPPAGTAGTTGSTPTTSAPSTEPSEAPASDEIEPTPPTGDAPDDGEHTDDPCAPADGSDTPEGCPEGLHGVILPLEHVDALDLWIGVNTPPRDTPQWTQCDAQELAPKAVIAVSSNNPIEGGVVTWWDEANPTETHEVEFSDSASEASAFETRRHDDGFTYDVEDRFQHCITIDGLERSHSYTAVATATDAYGSSALTHRWTFRPGDNRTRPPTVLGPYSGALIAAGWSKPGTTLRAIAYKVGRDDDPLGACERLRTEGRLPSGPAAAEQLPSPAGHRTLSAEELAGDEYPYDPAWNQIASLRFDYLDEGSQYSICLGRIADDAPSFDRARMTDAEVFSVTTPNRLRPTVKIHQVSAGGVRTIESWITAPGRAFDHCSGAHPVISGETTTLDPPETVCSPEGQTRTWSTFARGMDMHLRVDANGREVDSVFRLDAPLPACSGPCADQASLWFTVPLPSSRVGSGMCQEPCDPPTTVRSLGTMLVEVSFDDGASAGGPDWQISEAAEVSTTDEIVGDAPQFDTTLRLAIHPGARPSATVPIRTDRPTRARVELFGVASDGHILTEDEGPCLRGGARRTLTDDTLATSHSIELTGLCGGERYGLRITVEAANGSSSVYGYGPGLAAGWRDALFAVPAVTAQVQVEVRWHDLPNNRWAVQAGAEINNRDGLDGTDLRDNVYLSNCRSKSGSSTFDVEVPLSETVDLAAHVTAGNIAVQPDIGCHYPRSNPAGDIVWLRASVDLADIIERGSVTIRSRDSDALTIWVTYTFTDIVIPPST